MSFRLLLVFTLLAAQAAAETFTFAAIGCMPYHYVPDIEARTQRLTAEINRLQPAFTVHCGDIHSGGEPASDERFLAVRDWFDRFEHPLIYTPGDNEWTDAHRPAVGGYEPQERLARLREIFFAEDRSRGARPMDLVTQRSMPGYEKFSENARWTMQGVVFATVHVVGSNNNLQPDIPGAPEEFAERDAANIAWLRAVFAEARVTDAPGVALFMQAQPFGYVWEVEGFMPGFADFLAALEEEVRAFGRPVLLVHADEHKYRLEQRVAVAHDTAPIPNLVRLETFGARDIHGVVVIVDPASQAVFAPGPLLVPGNPLPKLPAAGKADE
ncbi:MAG TPA: hypothetical protein PLF88_02810 [Opitutaceae bacterium]|nr:hypothetical protein [Opitutaceae bacterium]HRJ48853.1 hypothetical protein [Opitutaceae bacterium]